MTKPRRFTIRAHPEEVYDDRDGEWVLYEEHRAALSAALELLREALRGHLSVFDESRNNIVAMLDEYGEGESK